MEFTVAVQSTPSAGKKMHNCPSCTQEFSTSFNLKRHLKIHADEKSFICSMCSKSFIQKWALERHMRIHLKPKLSEDLVHKKNLEQSLTASSVSPDEDVLFKTTSPDDSIKKLYTCDICQKVFGRKFTLSRHRIIHDANDPSILKCDECPQVFTQGDNLKQHRKIHEKSKHSCGDCAKVFGRRSELREHVRSQHSRLHPVGVKRKYDVNPKRVHSVTEAFNVFKTLMFYPDEDSKYDLKVFQVAIQPALKENLLKGLNEKNALRWYMVMKVTLERMSNDELQEIQTYFRCHCFTELDEDNISQHLVEGFSKINTSFEEFLQRGSGWILQKIHYLELKIAQYQPLAGSSYIPTPKILQDKKAIVNIKNDDKKCLIWCLLAHKFSLDREKKPERVAHYAPYEHLIKMGNVQCPVSLQKIPIIENLNNLRINVFGYEEDEVCPLYISPKKDRDVINLLLIGDCEKQHYMLIRNFSRLMGSRTKHEHVQFYCFRCLHGFSRKDLLTDHIRYCQEHPVQAIKMPDVRDNLLKFSGMHLQHPVAYTIYADFESLLIPISSTAPSTETSYTEKTAYHYPCGYAYVIVGPDGHSVKPIVVYRGENTVRRFLDAIIQEVEALEATLKDIKPMQLTPVEEDAFQKATYCSICKKSLYQKRVRDHDHLTGAFRGAAHNHCNLNFKQPMKIPIIFHNLKNYDGHHIMTEIGHYSDYNIDVIASSMENYIMFKMRKSQCRVQMTFLDSFQFLPTSLEKLVENLDHQQFQIMKENFAPNTDLTLLRRKGVYPYDYFSSMEKFEENNLPPKRAFFNSLTNEEISAEDYLHAMNVWNTFNLKTLGEYHDLYVKTDVLLLADVFENFRKLCLQYYNIDCAHLCTAPSLAWQACLKMSETPLELLTDINMLLMMENGIRGGISMISRRYAKANIPSTPDFNEKEPSSYILYLDANNLYGWAMSQYLPYGKFVWCAPEHVSEEWILSLPDESEDGFIFEVDLDYPKHLHDEHNDYPVAPERVKVTEDMLSPYAQSLVNKQKFVGTPKLIPNLQDKKKYIVHYRNLKFYLELGLKLSKVHKVLKFKQSPWLKSYIDFNTEKRKQATSSFEKDFFKLLNNSVYGKTMENLRKRRNIKLCTNEKSAKKMVASPFFKSFKTFNEDLTAVERLKSSILMNRPIYVGFAILELSKLLMYDFHYNFIKKEYKDQATLLFTDTDSLTYHVSTEDIFEDLKKHTELFDFSDYPKTHPLYSEDNKKVIGKFKDEMNGEFALEFVGLKSKMYSIKSTKSEKKRAKGVLTHTVRHKISHEDYLECLRHRKTSLEKQTRIAQDGHNLYTLTQNKISLSPFDDKRYILDDGVKSLAYGHYLITDSMEIC